MRLPFLLLAPLCGCGSLGYYDEAETDGDTGADLSPVESQTSSTTDETDPVEPPTEPPTDPTTDPTTGPSTSTTTPSTSTTTTTTTTPAPPVVISITDIEPDHGPNAGGTTVTLTGSFDTATSFEFNGVAATVVSGTPTQAVVETPAVGVVGWVTVEAISGTRSDAQSNGFQYFEDFSGQTGTVGSLSATHVVGGYWSTPPVDFAYGVLAFTEGSDWVVWKDYNGTFGGCTSNYASASTPVAYEPGASDLELSSGGASAVLDHLPLLLGSGWFAENLLVPGVDVLPGAVYNLEPLNGNADWPEFELAGALEIPPAFSVTQPNLGAALMPLQTRSNFDLAWSGSGGDAVLVWIERQYWDGAQYVIWDHLTCAVPDTGSYTIPFAAWPDWFVGDVLHVQVGRAYDGTGTLPHDGSDNRMAGIYWVYGAVQAN